MSEAFDRIKQVHAQLGHAGYVKTFKCLHERFYGITKEQVQWLIGRCQTCLKNRPNRSRGELEPIISHRILERVQIDLIDMRHEPDGQFKWILHFIDHFSKFSCLAALKSKRAVEVADAIAIWVGQFEPPAILQCDNGREFKGVLLILLKRYGVKVINGRPRTPSTQGLVEQANGTVKTRLRAWKEDTGNKAWAGALPDIALKMNRAVHGSTGKSPYEIMFGRKPRWNQHLSPQERQEATIENVSDENHNSQSTHTDEHLSDDSHNFTFQYSFELDEEPSIHPAIINSDRQQLPPSNLLPVRESSPASTTSTLTPPPKSPSIELTSIEKEVQTRISDARVKMVKKHSKRHSPEIFQPGDFVTLKIPREDRASTDNLRIYCQVIKEPHPNRYQLQCKQGILAAHYPTKELLRIPENACDTAHTALQDSPTTQVRLNTSFPEGVLKI